MKRVTWWLTAVLGLVILAGCGGGGGGGSSVDPGKAGTILYILDYGTENAEIHMIGPDGSEDELFTGLAILSEARISPDGRYVVYTNFSGMEATFVSEMWIRRLEDDSQQRVFVSSTLRAEYCSVSHDSSKIVFTAHEIHWTQPNGPRELYVVNMDGTGLHKLTSNSSGMGIFWPSFSPDGTKIVCQYDGAIVIMNSDGSQAWAVRSGDTPSYSPDGTRIVFENSGLVSIMDADGSDFSQLPGVTGYSYAEYPCFSPDGTKIAFCCRSNSDHIRQIFIVDADGGNLRKLTSALGPGDGAEACSWGGA